jgi:hypothetical protein
MTHYSAVTAANKHGALAATPKTKNSCETASAGVSLLPIVAWTVETVNHYSVYRPGAFPMPEDYFVLLAYAGCGTSTTYLSIACDDACTQVQR